MADETIQVQLSDSQKWRNPWHQNELKHKSRMFLLTGGILAAYADGEFSTAEHQRLVASITHLFNDPEGAIATVTSPKDAIAELKASMTWLKENGGPMCIELFGSLAELVAVDGALTKEERRFMGHIATGLGIPAQIAVDLIEDAFASVEVSQ